MQLVIVVQLGIHRGEKGIQIHAVAVEDIFIDFFGMVPALCRHDGIGV